MNPIQKGDKLMFGIQDIVKIHERKLVQHETQIQNNTKHILEVEEQTIACIEELDTKCENIFHQLNLASNGNLSQKPNQIDTKDTKDDISSEIKEFILSSTKQAVESQPVTSSHFTVLQKEFNDYKCIVDRMKSELASTKDDLTNLKTLVTNVQSMNMELNMSVIKLLNSQNKPDVTHQQTNTAIHEEKTTTPIELETDTTELCANENEQHDLEEKTEKQDDVKLEDIETLDDSSNDAHETHELEENHEEKNEIKLEIVDQTDC
tara:strand:- start:762 stop:1553 length:792 start_codon:yes stop_codon:yes gene_type:complete